MADFPSRRGIGGKEPARVLMISIIETGQPAMVFTVLSLYHVVEEQSDWQFISYVNQTTLAQPNPIDSASK